MTSKFFGCGFALAVCLIFAPTLSAQFLTEDFDYDNGDLTVVSGGLWTLHSGDVPDIQVVDGAAVVTAPGSQDDNRQIGMIMGPTDTWYYAVRFTVTQSGNDLINNDYFIHFRPEGFGFRARLATAAPSDPDNFDYSFEIWASSIGDGTTPWDGDFSFGEEVIAVVRWENETGVATLWINPVDENSTNIMDDELEDAMTEITSIALRQDSTAGSVVTIPVLSVGDNFADVLAAVTPPTGGDCPSGFARGDVNQDGEINLLDVGPFVDAIGGAFVCEADIDESGSVDLLDVGPFVALLGG